MVDNTSAVGNDSRPWVMPQSIKWLSTIARERRIPPDLESGGFPHLFGVFFVPPYRQCVTGSSWQQQQQQQMVCKCIATDGYRITVCVNWTYRTGRTRMRWCCRSVNWTGSWWEKRFLLDLVSKAGFARLLESPGLFSWKVQDLDSPGKSLWSWKVPEIKA